MIVVGVSYVNEFDPPLARPVSTLLAPTYDSIKSQQFTGRISPATCGKCASGRRMNDQTDGMGLHDATRTSSSSCAQHNRVFFGFRITRKTRHSYDAVGCASCACLCVCVCVAVLKEVSCSHLMRIPLPHNHTFVYSPYI